MKRGARLAGLGAVIGAGAIVLLIAPSYLLLASLRALWRAAIPGLDAPVPPFEHGYRIALGLVVGMCAAGLTAGLASAALRASARADRRALAACVAAALVWIFTSAWMESDLPRSWARGLMTALAGLGLGALTWLALWTPLVRAIQAARSFPRTIWAGARRLAAFGLALLATFLTAPLLPMAVGMAVRAAMGELSPAGLRAGLAAVAGCALTLGTCLLGFHLAGVPRRWPRVQSQAPPRGVT
jgi:hypothetical protein